MKHVSGKVAAAAAALSVMVAGCAGEQNGDDAGFPERPITVIFPFDAGSPGDLNARALADPAAEVFGTDVQVVNRPGAAGSIGVSEVLGAEPDGYTVGFVPIATVTVQPIRSDLSYGDPHEYVHLMGASLTPQVISVADDSPIQDLAELVEASQEEPVSVAVSGEGTILDINARMLANEAGARFETVSYDGEQQLLASMLGGTTDAAVSGVAAANPFIEAGRARPLAVFTNERIPSLPDTPTTEELGYDVTFGVNNFVIAPEGMDDSVMEALHDGFHEAWETDEYQTFLEDNAMVPDYRSQEELSTFLADEYEAYREVVEELGL